MDVTLNVTCLFPQRSDSRRPWPSGATLIRTSCSLNLPEKRRPLVSRRRTTSWMTAETASSARWSLLLLLLTWWHHVSPPSGVCFKHLFSPCGQSEKDVATLEPWLLREMDACISNIFLNQDAEAFTQLFNLILNENISGNEVVCSLKHSLSWSPERFSHVIVLFQWTTDTARRAPRRWWWPQDEGSSVRWSSSWAWAQTSTSRPPTAGEESTDSSQNQNKINVHWN